MNSVDTSLLELNGITKSYGHVQALRNASLSVPAGKVVALVGDNGAGKSTLVKIMSGLVQPDKGSIRLGGQEVQFGNPQEARQHGVAAVFQDLALVEVLDVATNLFMGQFPLRFGLVDRRRMERETTAFLRELDIRVNDVRLPVGMLSGGQRQIIALARALRLAAPVLILDEPTAALGVRETRHAGDLIRSYCSPSRGVLVVSHDLEFVFGIADQIQVLRLGEPNGLLEVAKSDRDEVVSLITGTKVARTATSGATGER
jgi:ABC-type sugar transport system ATPase subunit